MIPSALEELSKASSHWPEEEEGFLQATTSQAEAEGPVVMASEEFLQATTSSTDSMCGKSGSTGPTNHVVQKA